MSGINNYSFSYEHTFYCVSLYTLIYFLFLSQPLYVCPQWELYINKPWYIFLYYRLFVKYICAAFKRGLRVKYYLICWSYMKMILLKAHVCTFRHCSQNICLVLKSETFVDGNVILKIKKNTEDAFLSFRFLSGRGQRVEVTPLLLSRDMCGDQKQAQDWSRNHVLGSKVCKRLRSLKELHTYVGVSHLTLTDWLCSCGS